MAKKERTLYLLFGFLALLLSLPLLQSRLKIVDSGHLNGVIGVDTMIPTLSPECWLDGSFQQAVNDNVQYTAGFRPDFIRLRNQVDYTLFRKANARVVVGRNGNLFEQEYIDAYLGKDFAGVEKIRERVRKMKFIQDTLSRLGKNFVLVYAPSKVRYMPENLPGDAGKIKPGPTNYSTYKQLATTAELRQIDFNAWFRDAGKKQRYPVYTRWGIHWTEYGAILAADSFQKFMKTLPHDYFIPELVWNDNQEGAVYGPQRTENDLGNLLNLIVPVAEKNLFHPYLEITSDTTRQRPEAIYIADSYMWVWSDLGIPQRLNGNYQFWHYFNQAWSPQWPEPKAVADMDPMAEVLKADWIVIMYTECNFALPGGKFPEVAYDYFTGKK